MYTSWDLGVSYLFPVNGRIFDFQHAQTQDCIPSSLSVLPNPGNMGVAVGISLLHHEYELRYM